MPRSRRRATIAEIAKEAGVSVATVSRVINKVDHPINPRTRERVEQVIKRRNYASNVFGKGLAGQSSIIGVSTSLPLSADPGFAHSVARVLDGIRQVTRVTGYHVFLEVEDTENLESEPRFFSGVPLAGVLHIAPRENDPVVRLLRAGSIPFVLIGTTDFEDCNYVDADNEMAGRVAVRHLHELGRDHIAFVSGPRDFGPSIHALRGLREEMAHLGLPFRPEWVARPDFSIEGGREAVRGLLALKDRPNAIFNFTDFLAVGALSAARESGFSVPADLSIVGYDDFAIGAAVTPPLTTFRHPDVAMAAHATRALITAIQNKTTDLFCQELFEPALVIRESCGAARRGS